MEEELPITTNTYGNKYCCYVMSATMSARSLTWYILLPLPMAFVIVVIIVATDEGIELLVMNRWEVVIIAK